MEIISQALGIHKGTQTCKTIVGNKLEISLLKKAFVIWEFTVSNVWIKLEQNKAKGYKILWCKGTCTRGRNPKKWESLYIMCINVCIHLWIFMGEDSQYCNNSKYFYYTISLFFHMQFYYNTCFENVNLLHGNWYAYMYIFMFYIYDVSKYIRT